MGFDEGRLEFDHHNLVYNAGEVIHGKLVFDQGKDKTFRGIYVKLKGYCDVRWTTRHSRKVNNRTEHYTVEHTSHESYCDQKVYLIGSNDGEVHIKPGHYEFPFQLIVPHNGPSSFEGSYGHVRYEVKAVVDRAFKFDQEKKITMTVVRLKDLNLDPYCKEPMHFVFEQTYCCWCMSQGLCTVKVSLPQRGYCARQTIRVDVSCDNKSNVELKCLKFEVVEKRHYTATHHADTRTEKNIVAKLKKGPVPGNTSRNWTLEMDVPDMELPNLDACKYIDIDFWFKVTVSPSGCHSDSDDKQRLVLGHIPLREFGEGPENTVPAQEFQPASYPPSLNLSPYPTPNDSLNPGVNGTNSPYPVAPYPNQVNPGMHFPSGMPENNQPGPYPGVSSVPPYPGSNASYPGSNHPYPGPNPPYPTGPLPMVSPYPVGQDPKISSPGPPGFTVGVENKDAASVPLLPPTAHVPYPPNPTIAVNPYATASAPVPSTPDVDFS